LPLPAETCLQQQCSGVAKIDGLDDFFTLDPENFPYKYGIFGPVSVEPIAKSVPEPSDAIAFSLIIASILSSKIKLSSRQCT
jgi:hypothetical protein